MVDIWVRFDIGFDEVLSPSPTTTIGSKYVEQTVDGTALQVGVGPFMEDTTNNLIVTDGGVKNSYNWIPGTQYVFTQYDHVLASFTNEHLAAGANTRPGPTDVFAYAVATDFVQNSDVVSGAVKLDAPGLVNFDKSYIDESGGSVQLHIDAPAFQWVHIVNDLPDATTDNPGTSGGSTENGNQNTAPTDTPNTETEPNDNSPQPGGTVPGSVDLFDPTQAPPRDTPEYFQWLSDGIATYHAILDSFVDATPEATNASVYLTGIASSLEKWTKLPEATFAFQQLAAAETAIGVAGYAVSIGNDINEMNYLASNGQDYSGALHQLIIHEGNLVGQIIGTEVGALAGAALGTEFAGPIGAFVGFQAGALLGTKWGSDVGGQVADNAFRLIESLFDRLAPQGSVDTPLL